MDNKEVEDILAETDWEKYWQEVDESSTKEIDAYRLASAKSSVIIQVFV